MDGPNLFLAFLGAFVVLILGLWLRPVLKRRRWQPTEPDEALQAAYRADPAMRVTCQHVQPIEDEAREQRVRCDITSAEPPRLFVHALDPGPRKMKALGLPAWVKHQASGIIGPHSWSDPLYLCMRCGSAIEFHQGGLGPDRDPSELNLRSGYRHADRGA
jgi:hypothetical protein